MLKSFTNQILTNHPKSRKNKIKTTKKQNQLASQSVRCYKILWLCLSTTNAHIIIFNNPHGQWLLWLNLIVLNIITLRTKSHTFFDCFVLDSMHFEIWNILYFTLEKLSPHPQSAIRTPYFILHAHNILS